MTTMTEQVPPTRISNSSARNAAGGKRRRVHGDRPPSAAMRSSRAAVTAMALFFVAQQHRTAHGFAPASTQTHTTTTATTRSTRRKASTTIRRRFQNADDTTDTRIDAYSASPTNFLKFDVTPSSPAGTIADRMPTWLRSPRAHLYHQSMSYLREAMVSSYLSDAEADFVLGAIEDASGGDPSKAAGAAEFCHILVDTTELDVDALVAGAFHYCTAVTAQEQSAMLPSSEFSLRAFWDVHESMSSVNVDAYGVDAVVVAQDAARLKRTEAVAHSVAAGGAGSDDADGSVNLRGLLLSETRDWRALAIRSAACLYRLRGLLRARSDGSLVGRMTPEEVQASREALHIFAPLASQLGMHRLKNELEGCAFRIKYRRQYRSAMNISLERHAGAAGGTLRDGLQNVLDDVTVRVTDVLQNDPTFRKYTDHVVVSARVKEPFSLWRKMLKTGARHILDVPDAIALRVVLQAKKVTQDEVDEVTRARERALCYYAQKMCVDRFEPHADLARFKDYIERPKRNGYQSLHYTARANWSGKEWPFEVQVRSEEMHRVAEFGFASHSNYKDFAAQQQHDHQGHNQQYNHAPAPEDAHDYGTGSAYRQDQSLEAYLKSVQEWHWARRQVRPAATEAAIASLPSQVAATVPEERDRLARLERVRARAERIAPYIEALSEAQSDLARDSVFVFLSGGDKATDSGKVLALPSGACVLDALREGERRFGVSVDWRGKLSPEGDGTKAQVEYNGVASSITERLHNGDVVVVRSLQKQKTLAL